MADCRPKEKEITTASHLILHHPPALVICTLLIHRVFGSKADLENVSVLKQNDESDPEYVPAPGDLMLCVCIPPDS